MTRSIHSSRALELARYDRLFGIGNGGRTQIIRAKTADSQPLPFGVKAMEAVGQYVGAVVQPRRMVMREAKGDCGESNLKWGGDRGQQCKLTYVPPKPADRKSNAWTTTDAVCAKCAG